MSEIRYVCTIEGPSKLFPDCVLDTGSECCESKKLRKAGKGKTDCQYWKPEMYESPPECPDCAKLRADLDKAARLVGKRGMEIERLRESLDLARTAAANEESEHLVELDKLRAELSRLQADRDSVTESFNAATRELARLRWICSTLVSEIEKKYDEGCIDHISCCDDAGKSWYEAIHEAKDAAACGAEGEAQDKRTVLERAADDNSE